MHSVSGGCHCGNILVDMELTRAPGTYSPRACDCDFCRKHCAAYVSDPRGTLDIRIRHEADSGRYRQGSGQAEFLLCRTCGVLVGVLYSSDTRLCAAVNVRIVATTTVFGATQDVSPQQLAPAEKAGRWQSIWFPDVRIVHADT